MNNFDLLALHIGRAVLGGFTILGALIILAALVYPVLVTKHTNALFKQRLTQPGVRYLAVWWFICCFRTSGTDPERTVEVKWPGKVRRLT